MRVPIRVLALALALCSSLFAGAAACGGTTAQEASAYIAVATPTPTVPAERQRFARLRFATDAGLAAGATDQWIVKPWRAGAFKKGAKGRATTLAKASFAGAFTYARLKAALRDAQGDPKLARSLAPLAPGINALRDLPPRLRKGDESAAGFFDDIVTKVKAAGKSAGSPVRNRPPTARQIALV